MLVELDINDNEFAFVLFYFLPITCPTSLFCEWSGLLNFVKTEHEALTCQGFKYLFICQDTSTRRQQRACWVFKSSYHLLLPV